MLKNRIIITLLVILMGMVSAQAEVAENTVEVMLVNPLDDERGYCLDIAGGQGKNAPVEKGLQAHTCYNYTGSILEDQGFDKALINSGQLYIPYFNVCMSASSLNVGEAMTLSQCSDQDTQKFELNTSGQLVSIVNPQLCVTVSKTEKKEGRGGSPVHVMRPVSLQMCESTNNAYQIWAINSL